MRSSIFILTIGTVLFLASCRFDKESEKYPSPPCDTVAVSYSQKVVPILSEHCYACHAAAVAQTAGAGIVMDSYAELTNFLSAFENTFRESITHTGSASPMPKGSQKLDACAINTLLAWIRQGKLDN